LRVCGVDLGLRVEDEIPGGCLERWPRRRRDRPFLELAGGFLFGDGVTET
jgi:hypothetical protein